MQVGLLNENVSEREFVQILNENISENKLQERVLTISINSFYAKLSIKFSSSWICYYSPPKHIKMGVANRHRNASRLLNETVRGRQFVQISNENVSENKLHHSCMKYRFF